MRRKMWKRIRNSKIIEVLKLIKESKIKNAKFYFLVGLPNESDEDIEGIIRLFEEIEQVGFKEKELKVNINPFVPKFNTPYENQCRFYLTENINDFKLKFVKLKKELSNNSTIKIKFEDAKRTVENARLQAIFSLGDQSTSKLLLSYYRSGATIGALKKAETELNFSIDNYFKKILTGYKPWNIA